MMRGRLLLSGGFDSPVAGYLVKKQGAEVLAVHFSNEPFAGTEPAKKSRELAETLGFKKFLIIDLSATLMKISQTCIHAYYFVLSKRLMLREAEKLAKKEECDFLITGESLGQVSSQTLSNLQVIDRAVSIPVVRPLIGFDKEEIIRLSRQLGIYELAKGKECCDALGPAHPATVSTEGIIQEEEAKLHTPI
jgi:thiamine biosynthesis protein ThiI